MTTSDMSTTSTATTTGTIAASPSSLAPRLRVLLVGKCRVRETGNATTISRFETHLQCSGWHVVTRDPDDLPDPPADLDHLLQSQRIQVAVGLHAFRSSSVLLACQAAGVPYVVVFGGTDVNEAVQENAKLEVMSRVVRGAGHLVAMTGPIKDIALRTWPSLDPTSVSIVPQAVQVNPSLDFDMGRYFQRLEYTHMEEETRVLAIEKISSKICISYPCNSVEENENEIYSTIENANSCDMQGRQKHTSTNTTDLSQRMTHASTNEEERELELPDEYQPFVLLVAGLRPVKDVLYVAEAWSEWQETSGQGRGRMVIMGPVLEEEYARHVRREAARLSGVRISPSLPPGDCQAVICQASVLVNSSRSESMPSTILEAMALGTPVLVRDIPGNSTFVTHGSNGLLYSSPESFISNFEALLQDSSGTAGLVKAARERVLSHHSMRQEQEAFLGILRNVVKE